MRVLSLLVVAASTGWGAEPVIEAVRVFTNADGVKVVLADLKAADDCLIRVTGSRTDFDGHVLPCNAENNPKGLRYHVKKDGGQWTLAIAFEGGLTVYPNHRNEPKVRFDAAASASFKRDDLLRDLAASQKDGSLAKFTAFDRKAAEAWNSTKFTEAIKKVSEQCATPLTGTLVFDKVTDSYLTTNSFAGSCMTATDAIEKTCHYRVGRETIKARITTITCSMGATETFTLTPTRTYAVTISELSSTVAEPSLAWLKENL